MSQEPTLPGGWDWRAEGQTAFYIDTYARNPERRCFFKPPIREQGNSVAAEPTLGWIRICTLFGRIYWKHEQLGLITYRNPNAFPIMMVMVGTTLAGV
jgi:hypothetical protein